MMTKKEHVSTLAKNLVTKLEQSEDIILNVRQRAEIYKDLATFLATKILTDEEIREKALHAIGINSEALSDLETTESDQYRASKAVVMGKFGEHGVNGLYYQEPVKTIAQKIGSFLMGHKFVEDVFPSDEELEKKIIDYCKGFRPDQLH